MLKELASGLGFSREWQVNVAGTWTWREEWIYGPGQVVAKQETGQGIRHYHPDHPRSIRWITRPDGSVASRHTYYPFGEEATDPAQTAQPLRFTGHERDLNAGGKPDDLDYMHARYYNSFLTRFLSTDPMDSAQTEIPQSWNKFAYTYNNPMRHIDPNGQTVVGYPGFSNQVGGMTDLIGALQQYSDLVGPARAYPWQKDFHGTAFMAKQFSSGTSDFNALVGHSLGAYSALDSARRLEKVGIPVNILVTIDAAPGRSPQEVPANVALAVNFHLTGSRRVTGPLLVAGNDSTTRVFNIPMQGVTHTEVDELVVAKILQVILDIAREQETTDSSAWTPYFAWGE